MFKNLTVGKKISLGFSLIILLAIGLGSIAVYLMSDIRKGSSLLAKDYMPEIEVVSNLERDMRKVAYDVRGYGLTENAEYLKKVKSWNDSLNKNIQNATSLAEKSEVLKTLGDSMKVFEKEVGNFSQMVKVTEEKILNQNKARDLMTSASESFIASVNVYLKTQGQKMRNEMKSSNISSESKNQRLDKIYYMNDAIDILNEIRVANYRSQATRDQKYFIEAMANLDKIEPILQNILKITTQEVDKEEIRNLENAAANYKEAMGLYLKEWKGLQELSVSRNEVLEKIVLEAESIFNLGIKDTTNMANTAMNSANIGNNIIVWGLGLTAIIGALLSFFLVRTITAPIIKISDNLKDSANQVAAASGQLTESSQGLSSSANEQASSIEETSSSLEEITGMVGSNVDNAKRCVELSELVNESSTRGNEAMGMLINSMTEILQSNEKIQDLVKVIGEIGEKTAIIDEIVFQTKLLSFNASVEAERAGEHGRGFAVVAQEVGNLAQMSGKAATEISSIVKDSIKNAESITTENKKKVESGNEMVKDTAKILKDISQNANVVLESVNSILNASQDQSSGISQINIAVSQLDKATQENAATAEEAASTSEELSAQAESLNKMVAELTTIVLGKEAVTFVGNEQNSRKIVKKPSKLRVVSSNNNVHKDFNDIEVNDTEWEAI